MVTYCTCRAVCHPTIGHIIMIIIVTIVIVTCIIINCYYYFDIIVLLLINISIIICFLLPGWLWGTSGAEGKESLDLLKWGGDRRLTADHGDARPKVWQGLQLPPKHWTAGHCPSHENHDWGPLLVVRGRGKDFMWLIYFLVAIILIVLQIIPVIYIIHIFGLPNIGLK